MSFLQDSESDDDFGQTESFELDTDPEPEPEPEEEPEEEPAPEPEPEPEEQETDSGFFETEESEPEEEIDAISASEGEEEEEEEEPAPVLTRAYVSEMKQVTDANTRALTAEFNARKNTLKMIKSQRDKVTDTKNKYLRQITKYSSAMKQLQAKHDRAEEQERVLTGELEQLIDRLKQIKLSVQTGKERLQEATVTLDATLAAERAGGRFVKMSLSSFSSSTFPEVDGYDMRSSDATSQSWAESRQQSFVAASSIQKCGAPCKSHGRPCSRPRAAGKTACTQHSRMEQW